MSGLEQISIGLIFVGAVLTLNVVMDGLQQLQLIRDQISEIQTSRAECEVKTMEEAEKIQEVGQTLEELKTVVTDLEKT
ncbi:MAG: hypothetical protein O2954_17185, partial [bacterium]|nr:hypothetical protein [bacterium]